MREDLFERPSLTGQIYFIFFKILLVGIKNDLSRYLRY